MKDFILTLISLPFLILSCTSKSTDTAHPDNLQRYIVDTTNSIVNWTGYKIEDSQILSHLGTVQLNSGTIYLEGNTLKKGSFTADLTSLQNKDILNTDQNLKLIRQLQSKDFFDIYSYPEASFTITSIDPITGKSDYNIKISGILKIKNISQDISFRANVTSNENTLWLNTEKFSLKQKEFGISSQRFKDFLIHDSFNLQISTIATAK